MSTAKIPSIFSRFSSGSSTRSSSTSSTDPSIPKACNGCNRYAKDGKGYDFNLSYPYYMSSGSASSTTSASEAEPEVTLRYAKDGKGHDFTSSYAYAHAPANYAMSLGMGGNGDVWVLSDTPSSSGASANDRNMRYAWHQGRQGS